MSESRQQIRAHVEANVGVHFNELVRVSGFAPGQIQYHLRRLIDDDQIVREELYGKTHYFPPDYTADERGALALFRRETARQLVVYIVEHEPASPSDAATDLNVARSTLEYHLDHLVEQDVVEKSYGENNRVALRLVDPALTATLLAVVTPTVSDRLVDRFTRLVDQLLEAE